jgi:hypothetical protein
VGAVFGGHGPPYVVTIAIAPGAARSYRVAGILWF